MKLRQAARSSQRGAALFALLIFALLAGSYGLFQYANQGGGSHADSERLQIRLARAKEALIAYAVTDATRPGRLPCPDTQGTGSAPLLTRDDCDAYTGGIPWKTLDLLDADDGYNHPFHYILSQAYGGDRVSALNSETATTLRLDVPAGAPSNDIVALIIAARGALDPRNADGDNYYYRNTAGTSDGAAPPDNNDEIIAITRQELMAAVELRIANQLRTCLAEHASSPDNLQQTYPWPAPLSNTSYLGKTQSLFGMLPATQPGNPEMSLKAVNDQLGNLKIGLNSASTASDRLHGLHQLQEQTAYAAALLNVIYLSATDLYARAGGALAAFQSLDAALVSATTSADTYADTSATLPAAFSSALPSLALFRQGLENSGFDLFINELQSLNLQLRTRIDQAMPTPATNSARFDALITPVNALKNSLLDNSMSPNPALESLITTAHDAATAAATAINLARKSLNSPNPENAIASANALYTANAQLEAAILNSRVNLDPAELSVRIAGLETALATSVSSDELLKALKSNAALLTTLSSGSAAITASRSSSLGATTNAINAINALLGNDMGSIRSLTELVIAEIKALKSLIETTGDNIAKETLTVTNASLDGFMTAAPATVTAARNARIPVKAVIYWADLAIDQSASLALLARRGVAAQEDSDASAFVAANRLLASLDGSTGSISLLEKSISSPTPEAASQAQSAYESSLARLDTLIQAASALDAALQTSLAQAGQATRWYGKSCALLQPATGSKKGWWEANEWRKLFFYQITGRIRPKLGNLQVNGTGNHAAVVVGAGAELPSQVGKRAADRKVANFFDRPTNADPSRDGDAPAPTRQFVTEGVSSTFNDRLAY